MIPAGERHWMLDGAPAEQQGALADLEVAREEYIAAIEAERKCLADQGIWVSDTWWEDNQLRQTFGGVPSHEQAASIFEVYRACHVTYARNVATGWAIGSASAQPWPGRDRERGGPPPGADARRPARLTPRSRAR